MAIKNKLSKFMNKQLRTLIFFVTSKCPLKCKHCFYRSELNKDIKELTLDEIKKIAENLPYLENIQFSGGEPFLRADLPEIAEVFYKSGIKQIGIPTNGFFTDMVVSKAKAIKKLGVNLSVTVSLDGFKEVHNRIRGRNCWDKAIKTFHALKKEGIRTGFSAALSKLNYNDYIELLKFLQKQNPDYINAIIVRAKPDIMINAEEFAKIRQELEKLTLCYLTPFYQKRQKLLNNIYYSVLKGEKLSFRCLAGKIIAVLEPDGFVRVCELRGKLANVRDYDYDLNKILKLDNVPKNCTCIHSCFVGPSMSYSLKWMAKNIVFQFA